MAVAEVFATDPGRQGNILFLAVPDEEASSAGARQVALSLRGIAAEHGLEPVAVINMDSAADDGDGRLGRTVALGTIGKLLLTALVVGEPAHACYPFAGTNAGALAGAIAAHVEWSPKLSDPSRGEPGLPPTLLSIKDSKRHYDVTTPASVWVTWNALTYGRRPDDLLAAFTKVCRQATGEAGEKLQARAAEMGATHAVATLVIDFATLFTEVLARDEHAAKALNALAEQLAQSGASMPEQCRMLTEAIWHSSKRSGPAVIVGFGSLPYLPVSLSEGLEARRLTEAVSAARGLSEPAQPQQRCPCRRR